MHWALAVARWRARRAGTHLARAAAHGDLLGQPVARLQPGYRQVRVPAPLASGDPGCYRHDEDATADCAVVTFRTRERDVATSAGAAPPWYYVVVGELDQAVSSGRDAMGYRIASVVLCAVVFGYALARCTGFGRGAWLIAAITPSAWFVLGVVGTSGIEIALIAVVPGRSPISMKEVARRWRAAVPLAVCLVVRPAALIDLQLLRWSSPTVTP
jgi:hypothetical protein